MNRNRYLLPILTLLLMLSGMAAPMADAARPKGKATPTAQEEKSRGDGTVKVYNGIDEYQGNSKHAATLQKNNAGDAVAGHLCGATVVAPRKVVTAAHCLNGQNLSSLYVFAGRVKLTDYNAGQGQKRLVTNAVKHPSYAGGTSFDVAVLTVGVDWPADFIVPVVNSGNTAKYTPGIEHRINGWGMYNPLPRPQAPLEAPPNNQKLAYLKVLSDADGQALWGGLNMAHVYVLDGRSYINGTFRVSCQGDSGSGYVHVGTGGAATLVGVVSAGGECTDYHYGGGAEFTTIAVELAHGNTRNFLTTNGVP